MRYSDKSLLAHFRSHSWLLVVVWTACIAGSSLWNLHQQRRHVREMMRNSAQTTFENDILYRRWVARRRGVYVRVSESTPPNPYLDVPDRDVTTTSGLSLTLVNPAYMARQVNEMAGSAGGSRGHITSLKPIRPENAPDAWETAALQAFEQGVKEVCSVERTGQGEYLRLMRPFITERDCLRCHAAQGYAEGDIRGGISVSVPTAPLRAIEGPMTTHMALAHLGLWAVGLVGIGISRQSLGKEILVREQAERNLRAQEKELLDHAEALRESEERYHALIDTAPDAIAVHRDGRFLYANGAALRLTGADSFEQLAGRAVLDFFRPEDREQTIERTRMVMAGNRLPMREARLLRLDGQEIVVEFHTVPIEFQGARAVQTIVRDVTERKRTEEALRELNATLESKVAQRTAELEQRTKQLQKLTLQLSQTEDRERRRIAGILHEDLQQRIAGARLHLALLKNRAGEDPTQQAIAAKVDEMLKDAIEQSRNLSHELSPAILHQNDLAEALGWLARQMQTKHGLTVEVNACEEMRLQSEALTILLFRTAQEMLLNVVQHARVREARLRVRRFRRYLCLSVSDHGRGFDPRELRETAGLGLLSIRERVELLGGRMKIRSDGDRGSAFHVIILDQKLSEPDAPKP